MSRAIEGSDNWEALPQGWMSFWKVIRFAGKNFEKETYKEIQKFYRRYRLYFSSGEIFRYCNISKIYVRCLTMSIAMEDSKMLVQSSRYPLSSFRSNEAMILDLNCTSSAVYKSCHSAHAGMISSVLLNCRNLLQWINHRNGVGMLNEDLWLKIFESLDSFEIHSKCMLVCKQWWEMARRTSSESVLCNSIGPKKVGITFTSPCLLTCLLCQRHRPPGSLTSLCIFGVLGHAHVISFAYSL